MIKAKGTENFVESEYIYIYIYIYIYKIKK